ncbi:TetR/AcrR family transcriptional regulator [Glutamicibacter nicotianae]|uniref:TetR/AcrR family transcriptional regulator n=1 Tax=Glutamicibacter nicotianae TaxID=37929 RepID=UPI000EF87E34|nr:TetR/AcrR family transcriptional regulator [Glutamicibacter nicotianae]
MNCDEQRLIILKSSSRLLADRPFEAIKVGNIAEFCGMPDTAVLEHFSSMHELGSAILTYEGESMRAMQAKAAADQPDPLKRIPLVFRLVGENLAHDIIVRAGIRIAAESHHCFIERKINPFRTWEKFLVSTLQESIELGLIAASTDVEEAAWLVTVAGLGTKDLLSFSGKWNEAPELLEKSATLALRTIICIHPERGESR